MGNVKEVPVGSRFEKFVTLTEPVSKPGIGRVVDVRCDCGIELTISLQRLRKLKSCGCLFKGKPPGRVTQLRPPCEVCGVPAFVKSVALCQRHYYSTPEQKKKRAEQNKRKFQKLRSDVIDAYGGKCACCGEVQPEFLSLDHVNNDGAAHRRELGIKGGHASWLWAQANGYPDRLQLLCYNCNCAKGYYGVCPHANPAAEIH